MISASAMEQSCCSWRRATVNTPRSIVVVSNREGVFPHPDRDGEAGAEVCQVADVRGSGLRYRIPEFPFSLLKFSQRSGRSVLGLLPGPGNGAFEPPLDSPSISDGMSGYA